MVRRLPTMVGGDALPGTLECEAARAGKAGSPVTLGMPQNYSWGVAHRVIRMGLEEFERGLVAPPTSDDVSITIDGRRLDSKSAVLAWWADVAADIEAEEAERQATPGA